MLLSAGAFKGAKGLVSIMMERSSKRVFKVNHRPWFILSIFTLRATNLDVHEIQLALGLLYLIKDSSFLRLIYTSFTQRLRSRIILFSTSHSHTLLVGEDRIAVSKDYRRSRAILLMDTWDAYWKIILLLILRIIILRAYVSLSRLLKGFL